MTIPTTKTYHTAEMLGHLREVFGTSSPKIAEHLNSLGLRHYHSHGDAQSALHCHREALAILDWNKCNALLFDRVEESQSYSVDMAITLGDIGNVLREMNDFLGAAVAYKECLDLFLEGLIDGGGALKRKLVEIEEDDNCDANTLLKEVDREAVGVILARHPGFQSAVRGISHLLFEIQCVKFVAQNAASSRRRRRMTQNAAVAENLKNAIASFNLSMSDLSSQSSLDRSCSNDREERREEPPSDESKFPSIIQLKRSKTLASTHFIEEEFRGSSRLPLPRPSMRGRRAVTTSAVNDCDQYVLLSQRIVPVENSLTLALHRFPGVTSIIRNNQKRKKSSSSTAISQFDQSDDPHVEMAHKKPTTETVSPRSTTQSIYEHFGSDFGATT